MLLRFLRRVFGSCEEKPKEVGEDVEPTKDESYDEPWCMPNFHDKPTPIKTSAPKHVKKLPSSRMARLPVFTPR